MEGVFKDHRLVASTDVGNNGGDPLGTVRDMDISPDETYVVISDSTRSIRTYPITYDMLSNTSPHPLAQETKLTFPSQPTTFAISTLFSSDHPSSCTIAIGMSDQQPIRTTTIHPSAPQSTNFHHLTTPFETWPAIRSLHYSTCGTHLLSGSESLLALFPTTSQTTKPSITHPTKNFARTHGFKGYITSLTIHPPTSILAVATTPTRHIALFHNEGFNNLWQSQITDFSLPTRYQYPFSADGYKAGTGVTQLKFSPDGRYLYIAERMSDVLLLYDIRSMRTEVAFCAGRRAVTNQKIGFDVVEGGGWEVGTGTAGSIGGSHEIWSGGTDGVVRVWRNPHLCQGAVECSESLKVGDMPVVGVRVVESGEYFVTAEGGQTVLGDNLEEEGSGDESSDEGKESDDDEEMEDDDESEESDDDGKEDDDPMTKRSRGVVTGGGNRPRVRCEGSVKVWSRYYST